MIDVSFKFRCPLSWLRNGHVNLLLAGSRRHFFLKKIKMIKERERYRCIYLWWPPKFLK